MSGGVCFVVEHPLHKHIFFGLHPIVSVPQQPLFRPQATPFSAIQSLVHTWFSAYFANISLYKQIYSIRLVFKPLPAIFRKGPKCGIFEGNFRVFWGRKNYSCLLCINRHSFCIQLSQPADEDLSLKLRRHAIRFVLSKAMREPPV